METSQLVLISDILEMNYENQCLLTLPPEIWCKILNYCCINDVLNLQKVNQELTEKSGILWKKYEIFKTKKSIIQSLVNEVKSEHEATKKLMKEKAAELTNVELYMNNAQIYNEYFPIVENYLTKIHKVLKVYYMSKLITEEYKQLYIQFEDNMSIYYFDPMFIFIKFNNTFEYPTGHFEMTPNECIEKFQNV